MKMILERTVREFDASKERMAVTYTDVTDLENDRIVRTWDVEPIPLAVILASRRGAVEGERDRRLSAIDASSARPLRAVAAGMAVQADHDRLVALETEAQAVRAHAAALLTALSVVGTADEALAIDLTAGWP